MNFYNPLDYKPYMTCIGGYKEWDAIFRIHRRLRTMDNLCQLIPVFH